MRRAARSSALVLGLLMLASACTTEEPVTELPFAVGVTTTTTGAATSTTTAEAQPTATMAELEDLITAHDGGIEVKTFCDLTWTMSTRKRLLNTDGDPALLLEAYFAGLHKDLVAAQVDAPSTLTEVLESAVVELDRYIEQADAVNWDLDELEAIDAAGDFLATALAEIERQVAAC